MNSYSNRDLVKSCNLLVQAGLQGWGVRVKGNLKEGVIKFLK